MEQKEFNEYHNEITKLFDATNKEIKSHAQDLDAVRQNLETMQKEVKGLADEAKALKTSTETIETKFNAISTKQTETKVDLKELFAKFLKTGEAKYYEHLTDKDKIVLMNSPLFQQKTLATTPDSAGGALVPITYQRELITLESNYCPMMDLARVITLAEGDILEVPVQGSTRMGVSVTAETDSRTETTNPDLERMRIQLYDYEARVKATNKLVNDAFFPLEDWLGAEYAAQVGAQFGDDVVLGTGSSGPTGFTAETVQSVVSGASAALAIATLPQLMMKVKPAYRKNGKWAANGKTIATVYGLALTTGYQPFVGVNPTNGAITFMGKDVVEMSELPDIGASAYPIYFGDWAQACWVVTRADMQLLRNPYVNMGYTWFYFTSRRGFKLVKAEAIAKMKSNNS